MSRSATWLSVPGYTGHRQGLDRGTPPVTFPGKYISECTSNELHSHGLSTSQHLLPFFSLPMATMEPPQEKQAGVSGEPFASDIGIDGYNQDDIDMARMGKKQEFTRNFNWISSVGFTSCTMGT